MDVVRKLLILAHEMKRELELANIEIEPVLPVESNVEGDVTTFTANLSQPDDLSAARAAKVRDEGGVLHHVSNTDEDGTCRVKIAKVDDNDPLFEVRNGENALAFYGHYYQSLPLVLHEHGADGDVIAAGVFAGLLHALSWGLGI